MIMKMRRGDSKVENWKNKILYLTYNNNTRILGTKLIPEIDADGAKINPIVCNEDTHYGSACKMGIFGRDSQVYIVGGFCKRESPTDLVYKLDKPSKPGVPPTVKTASDLPKMPVSILHPLTANIDGDVYVLNVCTSKPAFFVLRAGDCKWSHLTPPPIPGGSFVYYTSCRITASVIGNMLCVTESSNEAYCFDFSKEEWDVKPCGVLPRRYGDVSITLSMILHQPDGSYGDGDGEGYDVVITTDSDDQIPQIYATLVDGRGNVVAVQHLYPSEPSPGPRLSREPITKRDDKVIFSKLFKLDEEEECCSSTFCYVCVKVNNTVETLVLKVTVLPGIFGEGEELPLSMKDELPPLSKEARLVDFKSGIRCYDDCYKNITQWLAGYDFLRVEVIQKCSYHIDNKPRLINEAFFY